jgi:hypothetical protein
MKLKIIALISFVLFVSNLYAAVTPLSFSGKPWISGTIDELSYVTYGSCKYIEINFLNKADNQIIYIAIPVEGGAWSGGALRFSDVDASRYYSMLLTAMSTGSPIRGKVHSESSSMWKRCGDNMEFYIPEYFTLKQ